MALEFESANDDLFQAYRNAIALFEQSKIALSLRDENHKMMQKIDAMLKFSIGGALKTEGDILGATLEAETEIRAIGDTKEGVSRPRPFIGNEG